MKKLKSASFFLFIINFIFISSLSYATTVRGRLDRFGLLGIAPASDIQVTLYSRVAEESSVPSSTGSDGMYYFHDVTPGVYVIEIWVQGFNHEPLKYEVEALDQEYTNISPILINWLKFVYPKKDSRFKPGSVIKTKGIHLFPTNAHIWIVLSDSSGNLFLQNFPIRLKANGLWASKNVYLCDGKIKIHAVLVTKEGDEVFKEKVTNKKWVEIDSLPAESLILTNRKIEVR